MMKKFLALLLVLCMLLCMSACGTKDIVSDISSDIIPETAQSQTENISSEETTDDTESKISTPVTTPSQTQTTVQPTPQPQHTHSYTTTVKAATCTEQGYTTYTCSCGDTYNADFITPSHKYDNYKCSVCSAIDKEHTYEYLVNWIIKNGTIDGEFSYISYTDDEDAHYFIVYQASNSAVIFNKWYIDGHFQLYTDIIFDKVSDTCEYTHEWNDLDAQLCAFELCGDIKNRNFTDKTPISYKSYNALYPETNVENNLLNVARYELNDLLIVVEGLLRGQFNSPNDSGLTLKDIGFDMFIDSVLEDY